MARKYEEFVGRRIRLRRDIHLKNGEVWPKGAVCKVTSVQRGDMWLKAKNFNPDNIFGSKFVTMHGIEPGDFDLLPDKPKLRCPDAACSHLIADHTSDGCSKCKCTMESGAMVHVEKVAAAQTERPKSDDD